MLRFNTFLFTLLLCLSVGAQTPPGDFDQGLESLQKGDYAAAKEVFQTLLQSSEPGNPDLLYNLALAEMGAENWGAAAAYLRQALYHSPLFFRAQRALKHVLDQLNPPPPTTTSQWHLFKAWVLRPPPLTLFFALAFGCAFGSAWLWLDWIGRKRVALVDETEIPPVPLKVWIVSAVAVLVVILSGLKLYDWILPRATSTQALQLHSGPNSESATVGSLPEGSEVVFHSHRGEWVRITHPAGATGWAQTEQFIPSSGKLLW